MASRIRRTLGRPFLKYLARYAPELWEEIQEFRHQRVFSRLEGVPQEVMRHMGTLLSEGVMTDEGRERFRGIGEGKGAKHG